jgi:hypothetical protein
MWEKKNYSFDRLSCKGLLTLNKYLININASNSIQNIYWSIPRLNHHVNIHHKSSGLILGDLYSAWVVLIEQFF